jgi:uncharacterized protein
MARPVALITGASAGIGRVFADRLAAEGHDLVLVARGEEQLQEVAQAAADRHGAGTEVMPSDLSDPGELAKVEARASERDRPLDLLVNNAGFGTFGPFHELPMDKEEEEIRLNVVALARLTRAALPVMVDRGRGGILNVSSLASFQPGPYNATYAATKAFVTSFSQSVHEEVRGTGVRITALCPGFTRTDFQDRAEIDISWVPEVLAQTPDQVVDASLRALRRGSAVYVSGIPNKVTAAFAQVTPMAVTRRFSGLVGRRLRQRGD